MLLLAAEEPDDVAGRVPGGNFRGADDRIGGQRRSLRHAGVRGGRGEKMDLYIVIMLRDTRADERCG